MKPVKPTAEQVLLSVFGYPAFRGEQAAVVEHVIDGGDALVLMPTGGGKSLCYQIPALLRAGTGIVVSPLIALMQDQVDALRQLGVRAAFLNSTLDGRTQRAVEQRAVARRARPALRRARAPADRSASSTCSDALARSRCSPSTRRIASRNGATISAPSTASCRMLHERFPEVPRIALTATADAPTRARDRRAPALDDARAVRRQLRPAEHPLPRRRRRTTRAGSCWHFLAGHHAARRASSIACRARRSRRRRRGWRAQGISALPYHAGLDAADAQRATSSASCARRAS